MPRPRFVLLLSAALLAAGAAPVPLRGQGSPLPVEARFGAAVPVSSFSGGAGIGEGATSGAGFGVEATLGAGWRAGYAGFSQLRFGCRDAGCAEGDPYVATGVNAGLRIALAPGARLIPWVGVGALTTRVESPGVRGSPEGVSALGFGGEVAGGLWVRASRYLALTPAVRVSRVGTELPGGERLSLRYVVVDLGLALTF
ncbi:MAG: hypothetical protein FIA95_03980 [Gemmatimonadetes bacterium]|nr:hypothetical protein [Gemmatimonadota bacterium]